MSEMTLDEMVEKIVREDVFCNVDSWVRFMLDHSDDQNCPIGYDDLEYNRPDFDEMEEEEVIEYLKDEYGYTDEQISKMDDPFEVAEDDYNEPEVFEYWAVSDWLYRKLRDRGEVVIDSYPQVWGRCTTGQAIKLDGVIRSIGRDLLK